MTPATLSPLQAYQRSVKIHGFCEDNAQRLAVEYLQRCYEALQAEAAAQPEPVQEEDQGMIPKGVYLWGPVGRGKTWLMDLFFQSLQVPARRQHFHHFMRWVNAELFQLTGTPDPLKALARRLRSEIRVLCFDELFVSDIGDAMVLGGLFQAMFAEGIVMVATSNQPPEQLYNDGFNRERFLPAIQALQQHMEVVSVDGGQDHRLHPGPLEQRYWVREEGQPSALSEVFSRLSREDVSQSNESVQVNHRTIEVVRRSDHVLWCQYEALCEQPLAAVDFIALCDQFRAILLGGLPRLSGGAPGKGLARGTEDAAAQVPTGDRQHPALVAHDDGTRRFMALVDECYDRKIPLFIEADVPLEALYTEGFLMFPFRRTLSRLKEMQLARFGQDAGI